MKPDGVPLVESEVEVAAKAFRDTPSPGWWERMFSLKHRITRTDFALIFFFALLTRFGIMVLGAEDVASGLGLLAIYCCGWLLLLIAGGKRARDVGYNQWWGVFSVFFIFGIVILLFAEGDVGPNRFGPDPRRKADI